MGLSCMFSGHDFQEIKGKIMCKKCGKDQTQQHKCKEQATLIEMTDTYKKFKCMECGKVWVTCNHDWKKIETITEKKNGYIYSYNFIYECKNCKCTKAHLEYA